MRRRAVKGGEKDKKEKDQKVYFLAILLQLKKQIYSNTLSSKNQES